MAFHGKWQRTTQWASCCKSGSRQEMTVLYKGPLRPHSEDTQNPTHSQEHHSKIEGFRESEVSEMIN